MICPRCGTVAAGQDAPCTRCGGKLDRGATRNTGEPPVPRAPTYRGELAQRAAGVVPQILGRPQVVAPVPPPPPAHLLPPAPDGPPTPSPTPAVAWPPPPAVWEAGPGSAPTHSASPTHPAPTHAGAPHTNPAPGWAGPGPGWTRGGAPDFARSAAGWARAVKGRGRLAVSRTRPVTPSNYLWQAVACLLLCPPCGAGAIVYAAQGNRRGEGGDMTGA